MNHTQFVYTMQGVKVAELKISLNNNHVVHNFCIKETTDQEFKLESMSECVGFILFVVLMNVSTTYIVCSDNTAAILIFCVT